jgi:uracil-DNA glycosylase
MQRNQWTTACTQLLRHWNRSGIHLVGANTPQSIALAADWLEQNSDILTDEVSTEPSDEGIPSDHHAVSVVPSAETDSATSVKESSPAPLSPRKSLSPTAATRVDGKWQSNPLSIADRQIAFDSLNEQVVACRKCDDIVCRRQRTVFGVGAISARVVMFGEAPGGEEDRAGEPFVGPAGQLLDKILVASGLKRPEVYIVNALKCRPPNNRTPTDAEIENCRPFFEAQLETIQPEYIVCWGSVAVRAVLGSTDSVGRLRGRFHTYRGAKVLVTYHPAYLLRTPDAKKLTWEDMKMLMRDMGSPIPGKS